MQPGGREGERESSLLLKTFWHKVINKQTKIKKNIFFLMQLLRILDSNRNQLDI